MKHERFGQTSGSAHQESRSLSKPSFAPGMFRRSSKYGNVLSKIESDGSNGNGFGPNPILRQNPSGNCTEPDDASSRNPDLSGERTAGRLCCNRQNPKARGCIK
jgi:hypothetical protein